MGKAVNIGVSALARKGKSGWIGVENVARKIKKMWVGVNGVAREFFSSAEPFYWIQDGVVQEGFPSAYNLISITYSGALYTNSLTGFWLYGHQDGNTSFHGITDEISTRGNKYMEVTISSYALSGRLDKFVIAGTSFTEIATGSVFTVDVSSMDTVTIELGITAWAYGNQAVLHISSIRFYS